MTKAPANQVGSCPKCGTPITEAHPYSWCSQCGERLPDDFVDRLPQVPKLAPAAAASSPHTPVGAVPGLATIFRILGVLELLGGIIISFSLWPREAREGYEYMPALTWLFVGIIFGCLFFAVAEGLTYLCQIRDAVTKKT